MLNLLKEIAVTGSVFPTHARLSLQFTFYNPTNHPLSPTYLFPIPDNASITGMQILTKEKTLLRAEILPLTETTSDGDGFRLIQLDAQLYSLTWECLPAGDSCTVILECLLHLLPQQGRCRLVLPFGISTGVQGNSSPCPANLDLILTDLTPLSLSPLDCFDSNTGSFSATAQTNEDFVLDLSLSSLESCGLLQEEFGKGCGFARLFFSKDSLENKPGKSSVLLLLDLSHATTSRIGNSLKELFFRIYSSVPDDVSVDYLTTGGDLPPSCSSDELFRHLQGLPSGTGSLDTLLCSAAHHHQPNQLTILISDSTHTPASLPGFPLVLATVGSTCHSSLSQSLGGAHLHFYPKDISEQNLAHLLKNLLRSTDLPDVVPEGAAVHDCIVLSLRDTLWEGYLDLAFSYSGKPPLFFSLWQDNKKIAVCSLTKTNIMPRFPDAEQLFAMAKNQSLTELLKKASSTSGRSIKKELAQLQTKFRILGSETSLTIPIAESSGISIPTKFYSATDGLASLAKRPTIFGDGIRTISAREREMLRDQCRRIIYDSIRSDGSIHSPLGITPQVSAEETSLSYLALLADNRTDPSVLQDVLNYLNSAPETPWSFLIRSETSKDSLQKLLPSLPDLETLLDSLGESIPLMTAGYLLLWLSLM